ncbi:hypothetical protein UlMin_003952 [Ulmus minor]
MDEKVEQSPSKTEEKSMNYKLTIPEINLDDLKKQSALLVSPTTRVAVMAKSPSTRWNCLCSPTTHVGSFRCRHHRNSGMYRGGSVGSNLSELGRKSSRVSGSLHAQ